MSMVSNPFEGCGISFFQFSGVSDIIMTFRAKGKALMKWFSEEKRLENTLIFKGTNGEEIT
jgi:hypothetical protein